VVAHGTHEQLLATSPLYRDTYALQLQADDDAARNGQDGADAQNTPAGQNGHAHADQPTLLERAPS